MKNNHLKITFIIACLIGGSLNADPSSKPKLTGRMILWLDDKPMGLDVTTLGDILHVRRGIRKILFGIQDPVTKKFVGFYMFEGQKRTLRWLADYERGLTKEFMEQKAALERKFVSRDAFTSEWEREKKVFEKEFEQKIFEQLEHIKRSFSDPEDYDYQVTKMQREATVEHEHYISAKEEEVMIKHIKNRDEYHRQLKQITDAYQKKMMQLLPCLKMAISDFITANEPFALKMQGTKSMMLILVEEFCLKYRRPYSFLLEWSNVAEGQEVIAFQRRMTSCTALDAFCDDLAEFLGALYLSCTKARAKYEAKERANREKTDKR